MFEHLYNVNWKFTPMKQVTPHQFNHVLDVIESKLGMTRIDPEPGKKLITYEGKLGGHYFVNNRTSNDITLYAYICTDEVYRPMRFSTTHSVDPTTVNGAKAAQEMYSYFMRKTKRRFPDVYGNDPDRDELFWRIKSCVPAPISYAHDSYIGTMTSGCSKADVSSAFPFEASKPLPTLKGAIEKPGRVAPSEEYPFAFYPFDGSLAILGEFDSGYFYKRPEYKYDGFPEPPYPQEVTILCKKADDDGALGDMFRTKFSNRQNHPRNKATMNSFIGFWHMRSRPAYSHMAAVTIARCNHRILMLCDELVRRGQNPILINCDSILWVGEAQPDMTSRAKTLGAFMDEGSEIDLAMVSSKKYQLRFADGTLKTVWSGVKREIASTLTFGGILFEDRPGTMIVFDKKINRMIEVDVDEFGLIIGEGRVC